MVGGLAEGVDVLGLLRGAHGGGQALAHAVGAQPVAARLGGRAAVARAERGIALERLREREVRCGALARQRVGRQRLDQQGVAEREGVEVAADEHVMGDRLAERLVQVGLRQVGRGGDQPVGDEPAVRRSDPQDLLRGGGELLDAQQQDVADARGQRRLAARRGEQLLREERVALAALVQARHQVRLGLLLADRPDQRPELRHVNGRSSIRVASGRRSWRARNARSGWRRWSSSVR